MRISDWSSDVCSSDLVDGTAPRSAPRIQINAAGDGIARDAHGNALGGIRTPYVDVPTAVLSGENASTQGDGGICFLVGRRSEERRVGKECVSTCRSRWSRYH